MQRQARHRGSFINDTLSLVWYLFTEQIPCNPHSYICILGNLLPLGADVILERSPAPAGTLAQPPTATATHSWPINVLGTCTHACIVLGLGAIGPMMMIMPIVSDFKRKFVIVNAK